MRFLGYVIDIFIVGKRLCVGKGDTWQMMLDSNLYNFLRRQLIEVNIRWKHLRDVMVLTVETAEITTCTGQRQTAGSRMKLIQGFLLNRVISQDTGLALDQRVKPPFKIPSAAAFPMPAFRDDAAMRAKFTHNRIGCIPPFPVQLLIKSAFVHHI